MTIEVTCGFDLNCAAKAIKDLKEAQELIEKADMLMRGAESYANTDTCPDEVDAMQTRIKENIDDLEQSISEYEERG